MNARHRFLNDYGMVLVLLLIGIYYSIVTLKQQQPSGREAAENLAAQIAELDPAPENIFIAAGATPDDPEFVESLTEILQSRGSYQLQAAHGTPAAIRQAIDSSKAETRLPDLISCSASTQPWNVFTAAADVPRLYPDTHRWPDFLKRDNLRNVANQIAVIAIIAIGMTLVIITAGIDLSVGSLIALSTVAAAAWIRSHGGVDASTGTLFVAAIMAIALSAACGAINGAMVTAFRLPAFIVTLAMMLIASGIAYDWTGGESIKEMPTNAGWLGKGSSAGLPHSVILMFLLYAGAHLLMSRTALGRYIYAVGGNPEAARLSGVPVRRVLLLVYIACGGLAGLGGVITASQFESGSPTYGFLTELTVIAAVIVGGTSIAGGRGKIFGTLIGAFIIAVIQNGMNLTGISSFRQKIVLGVIIVIAVLLDRVKQRLLLNE